MYSPTPQTPHFQALDQHCKNLIGDILSNVKPCNKEILVPAHQPIDTKNSLYLLKEGAVTYSREGKILFYLDEGDLIGLEERDVLGDALITSSFAVRVQEYARADFLKQLPLHLNLQEKWNAYVAKQLSLYVSIISSLFKNVVDIEPNVKHYGPGELIMSEGSDPDMIYMMVQGAANVEVKKQPIGIIETDEVFGAYSCLSNTPRAASVVASNKCLVMSVKRADFLTMLGIKNLNFVKVLRNGPDSIVL